MESGSTSLPTPTSSNLDHAYSALCELFIGATKSTIPRSYIPTWNEECDAHYTGFLKSEPGNEAAIKASNLTKCLNQRYKECWEETAKSIDFTHSRRLAWKNASAPDRYMLHIFTIPVSTNSIADQFLANSRFFDLEKYHTLIIK